MKAFVNRNVSSVEEAVALARQAIDEGRSVSFAGGGTDLLQLMKDRIPNRPGSSEPDLVVHLGGIPGLDRIESVGGGLRVGALTTVAALAADPVVRERHTVLAEAAETVATPQIRNVGTVGGNIAQRPWCWYFRNGFPCYKAGGDRCFSAGGENQLHAILGGGPSYIVHPSDLAPALQALDATISWTGPRGGRARSINGFFVLPRQNAQRENALEDDEIITHVSMPAPEPGTRSTYRKIMDREAWTHALASAAVVLQMDGDICRRARIVLGGVAPIPWRVPAAEAELIDLPITPERAQRAGVAAVAEARPLDKNYYKLHLTQKLVERTILELADVRA